ncbi:MAG: alpha-1,4-glucan--maltose-1-phosphate maltosyltransferase [Gammaproteobacteria bacterium]
MSSAPVVGRAAARRAPAAVGPKPDLQEQPVAALPDGGRVRVVIEGLTPEIDAGRFPIKRVIGESVSVEVDAFADGHDRVACVLRHRHESEREWRETRKQPLVNDRWRGAFTVEREGRYLYTVQAWVDAFASWRHDLRRRPGGDPDLPPALAAGAQMVEAAAARAGGADARTLADAAARIAQGPIEARREAALDDALAQLMAGYDARRFAADYARQLAVVVDRERARYGAWYEFFPRSCSDAGHGRLADCVPRLDYAAAMGFDVIYLPPIHPIGRSFRKGRNNTTTPEPGDVGSPWGIGAKEGGHKSLHPELGTLDDFRRFVEAAQARGLAVALDLAFQCAPDHPYVGEHPEWFRRRPDGSIQYAENPPKKYQDIYPFDFETDEWPALWRELKSVVDFWVAENVRIFRVDNPHTKPFPFWEWLIGEVKRAHPDVLFLSEAFTRPKVMHRLAKLGFTQSYTYFTWRNTKHELTAYFTELTEPPGSEYFRPNVWPNTPDILNEYLQFGGRPGFMIRFVLAATLAATYGIYGPAFELMEAEPREPGSEEYRNSEKYEIRRWNVQRPDSLRDFITRVNRIRREHPALHSNASLQFHPIDNEQLICFSKATDDGANIVLVIVNLDPHHRQSGWLELPLERFRIESGRPYQMHDLLGGARYLWHGARNYVELDPQAPAHLFILRRHVRREQDFDYYM